MSNAVNKLGGKCPNMPFLGRGQMSGGEHVRPPDSMHVEKRNKKHKKITTPFGPAVIPLLISAFCMEGRGDLLSCN